MALIKSGATSTQPPKMTDETVTAPAAQSEKAWEDESEVSTSQAVVSNDAGAIAVPAQDQPKHGFASLEGRLGFGSFPQVKLDKDKFVVGEEGELDEFDFHAFSSQSRWIYKADKETFFFSYHKPGTPGATASNGQLVKDILADWAAAGKPLKETREYQEVYGRIKDGAFAERMVVLSIPPVSVTRLSGLMAEQASFNGLATPDKYIIHICKGKKITTKSKDTFYPWEFRFKCKVEDYSPGEVEEAE